MNDQSFSLLPDVRNIAVLRPSAVGDFIFALPCLHALKTAYPQARITYIGRQWHADFLADRPGAVDRVVVVPSCPGIGLAPEAQVDPLPVQDFVDEMHAARFDLALQIYGGGRYSNPFIMRFGARLTIGMRAPDAAALDRSVAYGALQNRRLQLLEVAALAGANLLRLERELQATDSDRRAAQQVFKPEHGRPLVLLQPGASDKRRRWPARHFAALGDALATAGLLVAINGTAEEAPVVREVLEQMYKPALDLSGRLSLSALCGLLEHTALLVSNDTGPLHLGLALDTPTVGIYWLSNLMESAPLRQDRHRPAMSTRIHCPLCGEENLKTRCEHDVSFVDSVTVEEVHALAMELLATRRS
jgi:ADP-heptose:LPS heptosyltransferase